MLTLVVSCPVVVATIAAVSVDVPAVFELTAIEIMERDPPDDSAWTVLVIEDKVEV
jgi:hypothetical protein